MKGATDFFKLTEGKIALIVTLLIFLVLGIFGVRPFGREYFSGDMGYTDVNFFLNVPIYLFSNLNVWQDASDIFPLFVVLLIYYYLISCTLIFIYNQLRGQKSK